MMFYAMLAIVIFCIGMSLRTLFLPYKIKGKRVSFENFLFLILIYATIMIGFGLVFMLFELQGEPVLIEAGTRAAVDFWSRLETSLYFSAMTLFSVGYGDVFPIGIGRMIAVIEALIGYTIPAAFVARAVFDSEK
ncbi:transporter [Bacillus canaveralius]|uniref:Transporter n=1 Tax=Bacillus canaveralius TaxID=1403243 RepID=A0A2N5GG34_9BACI|nr:MULTISPECIES: ion channel [Bacillus]PLR79717.1 transporter [Bacillus canaveralius]PLR86897.1 transporter [Bacillus sp. V33-4]PLR88848.1 transporter [Bacillus canaveralius]RSK45096.1 two pore domain potassium channel family protein [Bacillus canaveralius]